MTQSLMTSKLFSLVPPDPKKGPRVRDKEIFRHLHGKWRVCVVCGSTFQLSLHHIYDRDDLEANLVMLCGDGVRGCHGLVTANDKETKRRLASYLLGRRPDTVAFLIGKVGPIAAADWFRRQIEA